MRRIKGAIAALEEADIGITPDLGFYTLTDFSQAEDMIRIGREAGEGAIPEIRRKLTSLQNS